jgi:hypothetical protein
MAKTIIKEAMIANGTRKNFGNAVKLANSVNVRTMKPIAPKVIRTLTTMLIARNAPRFAMVIFVALAVEELKW